MILLGSRRTTRTTKNNLTELLDAEKRNSDGELKKSKKRSKPGKGTICRTKKSAANGDVDMDEGDSVFGSNSSDSDVSTSEDDKDALVVSNAEVSVI
jgi:hypothetical protein